MIKVRARPNEERILSRHMREVYSICEQWQAAEK